MPVIGKIKRKIKSANDIGRSNLSDKGVRLPNNATTHQIMQSIADIPMHVGKTEQEKNVTITENGITEVLPDENKTLSKVTVNVLTSGGTEEIEALIDESGVIDSTEGTVSVMEKVEQLIKKANKVDFSIYVTNANQLFYKATSFPTKALVNLTNATNVYQAFSYWNTEPIPIVEEITVNAPNINTGSSQHCMGQMFTFNKGVKKVILNMPDESQYMQSTFSACDSLEEVVLNFSTKNIKEYTSTFSNCLKLKKIIGVLDFSSANSISMFSSCGNLEEVTFEPNSLSISVSLTWCDKLTSKSVDSIFKGLALLEVGVTQTLTLHKSVKILQSQVDSANAKGWTVAGGTVVSEVEYYG